MGDTLELFRSLCNGSVRVESGTEKLTGDAGFLLLREALDRTALIEALGAQLENPCDRCLSTCLSVFSCGLSDHRSLGLGMLLRWVEPDVINRHPVPGMALPAARVGALSVLVDTASMRLDRDVLPAMTLAGGDEADRAVTMFLVVPVDEARDPGRGVGEAGKRLKDGTTPRHWRVLSMVAPFMGLPLFECSTRPGRRTPSARQARSIKRLACSALSSACTSQPTILRLKRSSIRYRR